MTQLEPLEPRRLLSGNISVTTGPGLTAKIIGDNGGDAFTVTLEKGVGYRVSGVGGTKVNGIAAVDIKSASALNFTVVTGSGKDRVSFNGAFGTQNLSIYTGGGDDQVSIQGSTHFGNLVVSTSGGNDNVTLGQVTVTQNVVIWTSLGNDHVKLDNANIAMSLGISTGTGDDHVELTNSHITKSFGTCTGSGNDELKLTNTGISGNVGISMSDGDDHLSFSEVHIKRSLGVCTGNGNDSINFDHSVLIDADASVNAGNGDNHLGGTDKLAIQGNSLFLGFTNHPKDQRDVSGDDHHDEKD